MVSEKCRYRVHTSVILIRILIRILIPILILVRVTLHLRIANPWERTVVVEEVLYTVGVVVLVRVSYGVRVPRRFGGFV